MVRYIFFLFFFFEPWTSFTFSPAGITSVWCFHILVYLPLKNISPSLSQHLWAKPQEWSFKMALWNNKICSFFLSHYLIYGQIRRNAEALKSSDTAALKDRKPKWLYKMLLQPHLVTGLSWAGELMVALVHLNFYVSRFMEQLIVWMALYV